VASNTDTLKEGYQAFANGDAEAAMENFADDIVWEGPNSDRVPGSGTHTGKDAILQSVWGAIPQHWDDFSVTPDEFYEQDDTVIVLGHNEAKAKSTGRSVKVPFVHVWRFEGGKAKRVLTLTDTAVVAEALEG
jgi:ketosteroid isomerase-like protein